MRPHGQFTWTDMSSPDPAAASAFYQALFGWDADDQTDPEGNYIYTMFSMGGRSVAGLGAMPQEMQDAGVPPLWNSYVTVHDLDATLAAVTSAGGSILTGPMDVFTAGRMAFVTDPEGSSLALWQAGDHEGSGVFNEPGSMTWNELATRDAGAAKAFYGAVLGWTYDNMPNDAGDYWIIKIDGKVDGDIDADDDFNGGVMEMDETWPEGLPAHWTVYFAVADTNVATSKLTELGGSVIVEPFDTPAGRIAVVADPHGASFSLIAPVPDVAAT